MAKKKSKLSTPAWILEGYDSPEEYAMQKNKSSTSLKQSEDSSAKAKGEPEKKKIEKTFRIRQCPKCSSDDVGIVLSGSDSEEISNTGKEWECHKCGWKGVNINEKELTEDEFMKYLDKKGEEVA